MPIFKFQKSARDTAILLLGLFLSCVLVTPPTIAHAELLKTEAKQAVLYDVDTRSILLQKNADDPIAPASFAKLMTMEVVFHALKDGQLSLDDKFKVSEKAFSIGGSTMFANLNSSIRVEDLIQGIIVQSANDGCIIIAEGMAGSEKNFVKLMNKRAKLIGLEHSVFYNSTGLTHEGQVVTMRDLIILTTHIQREYPEYYKYYSQKEFTWNKIKQYNRNVLLKMNIGADGIGTGFTEESGYALVGSFNQNGRHMIIAISGLKTSKERTQEAVKILDLALNKLQFYPILKSGETIGFVRANGGTQENVPVTLKENLSLVIPKSNLGELTAQIIYNGPISTPVKKGQKVATLNIYVGDDLAQETPLYAAKTVGRGSIYRRSYDAVIQTALSWASKMYKEKLSR